MGAEEARLFAREGCKVIVADVSDELGESVVEEIGRSGGDAYYMHSDVTSMESWESTVSETLGRFGAIEILVNNAGLSSSFVQDDDDFDDEDDDWDDDSGPKKKTVKRKSAKKRKSIKRKK